MCRFQPLLRTSARHAAPRSRRASTQAASPTTSHALAGLGGGAVVLLGVYGYFHYSGAAKVLTQAQTLAAQAEGAKDRLLNATPSPKQALSLLRAAAHSYASVIPGAAVAVDASFDQLESVAESHGEEVSKIIKSTFADLKQAVADGKGEQAGERVMEKLMDAVKKMRELVGEKGGDLFEQLVGDNDELKKALGGSSEELEKLSAKYGPQAKKIASDAFNQSQRLITDGGLNAETYKAVKELVESKRKEIAELAKTSGSDAWEAAAKTASPFLDKVPDVKELVEKHTDSLKGLVGEDNVKIVKSLYEELNTLAKSGKSTEDMAKEAKKIVEDKVGSLDALKKKAKDAVGDSGSSAIAAASALPGMAGLGKILGGEELSHLKTLAEKHGGDAEKLLESTYEEIKQVLKNKVEEAKKMAAGAKDDVKKEAKK